MEENQAGIILGNVFLGNTFLDQIGTVHHTGSHRDDFSMFLCLLTSTRYVMELISDMMNTAT